MIVIEIAAIAGESNTADLIYQSYTNVISLVLESISFLTVDENHSVEGRPEQDHKSPYENPNMNNNISSSSDHVR